LGLILLLIAGIVAGRVGGIAIRRQGVPQAVLGLRLSEPVVRGVPVMVRWEAPDWPADAGGLTFDWRDGREEYRLGEAPVQAGAASLAFPCAAADAEGSLVVRTKAAGHVITSQIITLAPAGPECVQ
jgi:hypothetical protein